MVLIFSDESQIIHEAFVVIFDYGPLNHQYHELNDILILSQGLTSYGITWLYIRVFNESLVYKGANTIQ